MATKITEKDRNYLKNKFSAKQKESRTTTNFGYDEPSGAVDREGVRHKRPSTTMVKEPEPKKATVTRQNEVKEKLTAAFGKNRKRLTK